MSSVTTDFPTASARRSRPDRFTDAVVAGYIRGLAGGSEPRAISASVAVTRPSYVTSAAATSAQEDAKPSRTHSDETLTQAPITLEPRRPCRLPPAGTRSPLTRPENGGWRVSRVSGQYRHRRRLGSRSAGSVLAGDQVPGSGELLMPEL